MSDIDKRIEGLEKVLNILPNDRYSRETADSINNLIFELKKMKGVIV